MATIVHFTELIKNANSIVHEVLTNPEVNVGGFDVLFNEFAIALRCFWQNLIHTKWFDYYIHFILFSPKVIKSVLADSSYYKSSNITLLPQNANINIYANSFSAFFNAFFNCFFLYFPFSPVQLIWLRSVMMEGPWSIFVCTSGFVLGHLTFLGCCFFGFRELIYNWYGCEPFTYIAGVFLSFYAIYNIASKPIRILTPGQYGFKDRVFQLFSINFLLVWTDQSNLFPFLGNLSFNLGTNLFDFNYLNSNSTFYFLGLIAGTFFWLLIFGGFSYKIGYFLSETFKFRFSVWIQGVNKFFIVTCLSLNITNLFYYGSDYIFLNPLGFLPEDISLENTILSVYKSNTSDTSKGKLGRIGNRGTIDADLSIYDRGQFSSGPYNESNYESLNYQDQFMWRSRLDRVSSRSLRKREGILNKYLSVHLGPAEQARIEALRKRKREYQMRRYKKFMKKKEEKEAISQNKKNRFEYAYQSEKKLSIFDLMDNYKYLVERFIYDYTTESNREDESIPELSLQKIMFFSAFSEVLRYGFDFFSLFDPFIEEEANEYDMKERYAEGYIYRFLLNLDFFNFFQGLPKEHRLNSFDEIELFKKRHALYEYLNTLRGYYKLRNSKLDRIFNPLLCGPKSFENRIYNQQFKGTIKIVERLFSVHLEDEQNIPEFPIIEYELSPSEIEKQRELEPYKDLYLKMKKDPSVLKFDQLLYKNPKSKSSKQLIHNNKNKLKKRRKRRKRRMFKKRKSLFIKESNPVPFFVAWNKKKRKFSVTNRILQRESTLKKFRFDIKNKPSVKRYKIRRNFQFKYKIESRGVKYNNEIEDLDIDYERTFDITDTYRPLEFYVWPVPYDEMVSDPYYNKLYRFPDDPETLNLFFYAEPEMDEEEFIYGELPSVIERVNINNQIKIQVLLHPYKGGFLWPGYSVSDVEKISPEDLLKLRSLDWFPYPYDY